MAFKSLCSCETQLLELLEELTSSLSKGKQTNVTIMDFANAFDHVNNSLLCYKLDHYSIRGAANQWISSFLHERRHQLLFRGHGQSLSLYNQVYLRGQF